MELVADVKKKVTEINKRLNKDMDGFNHLDTIHRHLDDVLQVISYMEDKIVLRESKQEDKLRSSAVAAKTKKKVQPVERVDFDA